MDIKGLKWTEYIIVSEILGTPTTGFHNTMKQINSYYDRLVEKGVLVSRTSHGGKLYYINPLLVSIKTLYDLSRIDRTLIDEKYVYEHCREV
jgi:hypothetical protein